MIQSIGKQTWFLVVSLLAVFVLCGCDGNYVDRLGWSSDGKKLAMVAGGNLYLWSDADKAPVVALKDGVQSVVWLPDSKDALIIRSQYFDSAEQVLATADEKQKKAILETSEKLNGPLKDVHGDLTKLESVVPAWKQFPMVAEAVVYLALRDSADMKRAAGARYKALTERVQELVLQRYSLGTGAEASAGPVVMRILGGVGSVRVSRDGHYALCLSSADDPGKSCNSGLDLRVFDLADSKSGILISGVGPSADFASDAKSVVYIRLFGAYEGPACKNLGVLERRKVVGDKGQLLSEKVSAESVVELANIRVGVEDRLRCLSEDGVMLCTDSLQLPARPDDPSCADLFLIKDEGPINRLISMAARGNRQETLQYFELNQSRSRAALVNEAAVAVLDLKTGMLQEIELPDGFSTNPSLILMPSWKSDDELVFAADSGGTKENPVPVLMHLSLSDGKFEVMSKGWPVKLLRALTLADAKD